jgi:integrase
LITALYADLPVQRDRSFELTALGPDVLAWLSWLELAGRSDRTLDQYERDLSRGCLMYPSLPLERWSQKECLDVIKSFPKDSRRVRASAWDSFFTWAVRQDRIDRNPMDKLPQIKRAPQKFIDVFSDAEVDDLLSLPLADAALMGILFDCGLRKAEARALQVRRIKLSFQEVAGSIPAIRREADVVQEGRTALTVEHGAVANRDGGGVVPAACPHSGELVVIAGKGGKDRTIQFGSRLHGLLETLLYLEPMNPQDYLWYSRPGGGPVNRTRPIGDGSFDRWWRRCLKSAGVRYRNPHVTRHTFAVKWLRRGGRLETLSKLMGHSSIATTADVYGGIGAEDVLRDLQLMEAR